MDITWNNTNLPRCRLVLISLDLVSIRLLKHQGLEDLNHHHPRSMRSIANSMRVLVLVRHDKVDEINEFQPGPIFLVGLYIKIV